MKKELILYSLSTAINKGAILLFFPFLAQLLTLEEFGKWSLIIVVSYLIGPLFTLNGSASILREGSSNIVVGFKLLRKYMYITFALSVMAGLVVYILFEAHWFFYSIIIGSAEAFLLLGVTLIRTEGKALQYFLILFLKTLALFLLILYATHYDLSLSEILLYHFYIVIIFAIAINLYLLSRASEGCTSVNYRPIFLFGILLIPHSISQWVMSSSDRLIIEYMLGSRDVGVYSLAYNIALVLMLLNSGIALTLPQYLIKNYQNWKENLYDQKIIFYYTFLSILLFLIVLALYTMDKSYTYILGYYGNEMIPLISIIYISIYFLGLYYIYANYLFYHKRAKIISKLTFYTAVLNIILTILFICFFGVMGAAFATLLAYIYYLYSVRHEALKVESEISIPLASNITIFLILLTSISLVFYVLL